MQRARGAERRRCATRAAAARPTATREPPARPARPEPAATVAHRAPAAPAAPPGPANRRRLTAYANSRRRPMARVRDGQYSAEAAGRLITEKDHGGHRESRKRRPIAPAG